MVTHLGEARTLENLADQSSLVNDDAFAQKLA